MASEFQRKKVGGVFRAMDVDGDGRLTQADFQALAHRWSALAGPAGPERLTSVMTGWWPVLRAASGGDAGVSLDQVLSVVDVLGAMTDAVTGTADAMFEAIDLNGDGHLSREEFRLHWTEFWAGDDPDAPGSYVFGAPPE